MTNSTNSTKPKEFDHSQLASETTVRERDLENLTPRIVDVHENHAKATYFSEHELKKDPEARELEAALVQHAKPPKTKGLDSSLNHVEFSTVDDLGNKVPSRHVMTTFNQYGVNQYGQTTTQVLEEEREARNAFDDFSVRYIKLLTDMQRLKTEMKALEIEYKDQGLDVKRFKDTIKWMQKDAKKSDEERWYEGVVRQWATSSKPIKEALERLELEKEETKAVGQDKEERQRTLLRNMTETFDKRYENDKITGRGWLDHQIEQTAILASYGVDSAEEDFIKYEERKKIREARREAGLPDLVTFSNETLPANHKEFKQVYNDEFHQRRIAAETKQRENQIFNPGSQWDLGYEPEDVPLVLNFDELAKHGIHQARRVQDCCYLWKKHLLNGDPLPDEEWTKKIKPVSVEKADEFIKLAARVEDFLEVKDICDDLYLSDIDPRRDDWDSPSGKIERHNRLVKFGKIDGEMIDYDPLHEKEQVKLVAEGL